MVLLHNILLQLVNWLIITNRYSYKILCIIVMHSYVFDLSSYGKRIIFILYICLLCGQCAQVGMYVVRNSTIAFNYVTMVILFLKIKIYGSKLQG